MSSPVNIAKYYKNTQFEEHLPEAAFAVTHHQKLLTISQNISWEMIDGNLNTPFVEKPVLKDLEAPLQGCSQRKAFCKYAANLQQNTHTHAKVWFQ